MTHIKKNNMMQEQKIEFTFVNILKYSLIVLTISFIIVLTHNNSEKNTSDKIESMFSSEIKK